MKFWFKILLNYYKQSERIVVLWANCIILMLVFYGGYLIFDVVADQVNSWYRELKN